MGVRKKKDPTSSGLIDCPVLKPPPSVLVYKKKGFSYLWLSFSFRGTSPLLSCQMPTARLFRLRQVPFSLLAKSDSFQGSIWLVLSSKGLVLILVSLFLCSWLPMSESSFLREDRPSAFRENLLSSGHQTDNTSNKIQ